MPRSRLLGFWSSRLWIVAAVLGLTTVYSTANTIHDTNSRKLALGLVTQATAMHLSTLAGARLERLALEGFAPEGPLTATTPDATPTRPRIELLARRQREGVACQCRELLPVSEFFQYDVRTERVERMPVDSGTASVRAQTRPSDSALAGIARDEATMRTVSANAASRLIVDPRSDRTAIVALVQRDDRGNPITVFGMVVDRTPTFQSLFATSTGHSVPNSTGLARLDSLSLEIRSATGQHLYGSLGAGRAHAIAHLGGPLRGLEMEIAISPSRVAEPLLSPHSPYQLLHIALLLGATIIVLGLAYTASRRELVLARARSDFIAGVSHDLRMPLAQILIASETLAMQRERSDGERVSLASSIVRETRRLVGLVDNVLLFSRSGALTLTPSLRPVAVDELFDEVVDAVRLAVDDAGQTIDATADDALAVMADRRLVRQALVNLVDNALKYGTAGQQIRLGATLFDGQVRLWVEDEGPGIPRDQRAKIFEPYARLAHDQMSERTGTGLGLAVVRQIVEASGGRVWIEDATPHGTRAIIELQPAITAEPAAATVASL